MHLLLSCLLQWHAGTSWPDCQMSMPISQHRWAFCCAVCTELMQGGPPSSNLACSGQVARGGCCFAANSLCSQAMLHKCHGEAPAHHCCLQAEAAADRAELLQAQLEGAAEGSDSLEGLLQEHEHVVSSVKGQLQHAQVSPFDWQIVEVWLSFNVSQRLGISYHFSRLRVTLVSPLRYLAGPLR